MGVGVDVGPGVGGNLVSRSEQGLKARGDASTNLHDVERPVWNGVWADVV